MTDKEAMKLALEALKFALHVGFDESSESQIKKGDKAVQQHQNAITALQEALAEQPAQQEPVAWRTFDGEGGYEYRSYEMNEQYAQEWKQRNPKHKGWVEPLYTSPPQRTWVGLTEPEINDCYESIMFDQNIEPSRMGVYLEIEAKLKEKNT